MIFIYSLILSLAIVGVLSLVFREEAVFWLDKIRHKLKGKSPGRKAGRAQAPIKEYCGFRDWSDQGGEICTLFQLEDGSEYFVSEKICRQCPVWERYQEWLDSGKKENLSVTLAHTFHGSKPMVVETDKLNPEMGRGLTFNDFVIKRRRVPWAGKAAIAVLTLVTYLMVYFSGVFSEPVVHAMPDTFYFYDEGDKAATSCWNMRTVDPNSSVDSTTRCASTSQEENGLYCHFYPGANNTVWESVYTGPKKSGWMTDNDATLTGTIPSGTWTTRAEVRWTEVIGSECDPNVTKVQYKVWKASADLASYTTLIDWQDICTSLAKTTNTCSDTYNPGEVTLDNQVLLIEFRFVIGYKDCPGPPNHSFQFNVDEGVEESIDTPTYEPIPENSIFLAGIVPFLPAIIRKFKLKDYFRKK